METNRRKRIPPTITVTVNTNVSCIKPEYRTTNEEFEKHIEDLRRANEKLIEERREERRKQIKQDRKSLLEWLGVEEPVPITVKKPLYIDFHHTTYDQTIAHLQPHIKAVQTRLQALIGVREY